MAKTTLQEIDILANLYNKTKDEKYKIKWYQLVKEFADGINNTNRWCISSNRGNQRNDKRYSSSK